jgi:putative spermidine/putrescine transport system substrate-binding protein
MKKLMFLTTALSAVAMMANADAITVVSGGGAYGKSQVEAYDKPFTAKTGIDVNMVDADNPATPIKAQVEAKNVTTDVADVEMSDAIRLCDEGLIVPIDPAGLPAAPDGTPATKDFLPGALADCAVASIVFSTAVGYDTTKFGTKPPTKIADFFDTKDFPGKRGMRKGAKINLEIALMATGVPAADVYKVLATPEGVDKAFKELDTIKKDVVWWEAGAQPPQLLADGQVILTSAWNGRIYKAAHTDKKPFAVLWDHEALDWQGWNIVKGSPHREEAYKFIAFAGRADRQADQTNYISYGPGNKQAIANTNPAITVDLPTNPDNMKTAFIVNAKFWADNGDSLRERFNVWVAQ